MDRAPSGIRTHGTHWSVFPVMAGCYAFCKDHSVDEKSDANAVVMTEVPQLGRAVAAWGPRA